MAASVKVGALAEGSGCPAARHRKVTAWARVTVEPGEKVEPPPATLCRSVLLFGRAADWADRLEAYELQLAAPPENMPLPERTRKIYVGRYVHFEAETAAEVSRY